MRPYSFVWLAPFVVGSLHAADPSRMELIQTIPLQGKAGRLDHLALDAAGRRLFIANLSNNSLDVVDLAAGKLAKQIPGQRKIQGVAYAAKIDRIFVGNGDDGVCNVFDGKDYRLLKSFPMPDADNVRYDATLGRVYVAHAEKALSVIDAKTLQVLAKIALPGSPEAFQVDSAADRIFLNCPSPAQVVVIDLRRNAVTASYRLRRAQKNYPLAVDTAGKRVFAGCREPPMVVVLDAESGQETAAVEIPGDIDDLFFDAKRKRLYATCGAGELAIIEHRGGDKYELVEKIPTAKLARTGLFDPGTGRFYAVLPNDGTRGPLIRVYQARP